MEKKYYVSNLEALISNVHTFSDEDYAKLDVEKYVGQDGYLLLFDEQWKLVYSNDVEYAETLSVEELKMVYNYMSRSWYETVDFYNKDQEQRQLIFEKTYLDGKMVITDYTLLDEQNHIVSGGLLPTGTELSDRAVGYMVGHTEDGYIAYRYNYINASEQSRILILFAADTLPKEYIEAMALWENSQWWLLPGYFLIIFIFIYLLSFRIKKYLQPLHKAISEYKVGQESSVEMHYQGPDELVEIAESFSQLAQLLDESEKSRRYLEESKNRLLADISHDLKSPLTVVRVYLEAIQDGTVPKEQIEKYLQVAHDKTCAIEKLLNTFHQYSVLEHPDMPIDLKKCNICAAVQRYFADKYEEIEIAGFEIDAEIPNMPLYCMVDLDLFERALDNIVNNSLRYNPSGTMIGIVLSSEEDFVQIRIGDNGVGINIKETEKLFDSFVKGQTEVTQGSGLGLAITKKIIHAHQGEVSLCEEPSQGMKTEFKIVIPRIE